MKTSYLSPSFSQCDFQKASRDGLGNRFWIDIRLLAVKVKCPDPGVASHDQKPDMGNSLRHQIPAPCPHSPPPAPRHGIYIDRCINCVFVFIHEKENWQDLAVFFPPSVTPFSTML